jgi:hypothetical protein
MKLVHDEERAHYSPDGPQARFYLGLIEERGYGLIEIWDCRDHFFLKIVAIFRREEVRVAPAILEDLIRITPRGLDHEHQHDEIFLNVLEAHRLSFLKYQSPIAARLIEQLSVGVIFVLQILNGLPIDLIAMRDPNDEASFLFREQVLV